jgi:hypothetical protein
MLSLLTLFQQPPQPAYSSSIPAGGNPQEVNVNKQYEGWEFEYVQQHLLLSPYRTEIC